MTALSDNVEGLRYSPFGLTAVDIAASTTVYKGSWVCINSSGYAVAGADTAGYRFAGLAENKVDNSSGSNGDTQVPVWTAGIIEATFDAVTQADVGKECYILDSGTLTLVNSIENIRAGKVVEYIDSTSARVEFLANAALEPAAADDIEIYDVDANKSITAGNLVMMDEAVGDVMEADDTASMRFVGVASESQNNTGGSSGDKEIAVRTKGHVTVTVSGADATWVGTTAYATGALTCAQSGTNEVAVGTFRRVISATSAVVEYDINRIDESDLLHATGDGADVKTYTDADTDLYPPMVDVVRLCDITDSNIAILTADKHPDMKLVSGRVALLEVPDSSGDTLTVQVFRTSDDADMTDLITFTEGSDAQFDISDFAIDGTDHTIEDDDAAYITVGGTSSTAGLALVRLTWQYSR